MKKKERLIKIHRLTMNSSQLSAVTRVLAEAMEEFPQEWWLNSDEYFDVKTILERYEGIVWDEKVANGDTQ